MKRISMFPVLVLLLVSTLQLSAQEDKSKRPSPPAVVSQTLKSGATVTIDYSQPSVKGRTIGKDLEPLAGKVWRTGANAATQFTTSIPVKLAGIQLPAGTYTLFTVPHASLVDLIVNKETGQWGTDYKASFNLGTARITSEALTTPVEAFTISIVPVDTQHGSLVMEWGTFRWIAPIEVQ